MQQSQFLCSEVKVTPSIFKKGLQTKLFTTHDCPLPDITKLDVSLLGKKKFPDIIFSSFPSFTKNKKNILI
jgi:hypothetical protein